MVSWYDRVIRGERELPINSVVTIKNRVKNGHIGQLDQAYFLCPPYSKNGYSKPKRWLTHEY